MGAEKMAGRTVVPTKNPALWPGLMQGLMTA